MRGKPFAVVSYELDGARLIIWIPSTSPPEDSGVQIVYEGCDLDTRERKANMPDNETLILELMESMGRVLEATDGLLQAMSEDPTTMAHNPQIAVATLRLIGAKMELGVLASRVQDLSDG